MFPLRDENPTHGTPVVTVTLIIVNVLVFFYQLSLGPAGIEPFVLRFGAIPAEVVSGANLDVSLGLHPYLSVVSSMFLHGGFGHLLGNMWFLWIFGDNIEDFLGHLGFLAFYLATGVAATLAHVLTSADSTIPLVGASGAISGILGAYIVLHPHIRVKTLIVLGFFWNVVYVPALFFLGLWFLMQILGGFQPGGQVAYGAHVGGFLAGIPLILLCSRRKGRPHARYEANRQIRWRRGFD
jgi:membrane associated rhomboid family serine protease